MLNEKLYSMISSNEETIYVIINFIFQSYQYPKNILENRKINSDIYCLRYNLIQFAYKIIVYNTRDIKYFVKID